ncbi:hypothetical protein [Streptomyces sp. NPDC058989]|uniref:hypothetical protein n=1 Tax=Streptomyces sp. NPDC058989 TaxID=3346686 RepID=UPI0036895B87
MPASHKGTGRVTAFSMFGPVFGYASKLVNGCQTAYVGPLTPGVRWPKLWQVAERCCRLTAQDREKAQWIITQATRAFVMGSDVIAKLPHAAWEVGPGERRVDVIEWSNHHVLIVGNMAVPSLTPEHVSMKHTYYPHYFDDSPSR